MSQSLESFDSGKDDAISNSVKDLNSLLVQDVTNFSKIKTYVEELSLKQKDIEKRLQFASSESPDKVSKAIRVAKKTLAESAELEQQTAQLQKKVSEKEENQKLFLILDDESPNVDVVQKADKVQAYVQWINYIKETSDVIENSLRENHVEQSVLRFETLKEAVGIIKDSKCHRLKSYTCRVVVHWHSVLSGSLEEDFETILRSMKWPFVQTESSESSPSPSLLQKLTDCLRQLIRVQLSEDVFVWAGDSKTSRENAEAEQSSIVSNFSVSSVPVKLLLKPLEVRFFYHFSGEKATNSDSNPEWYFTQVLKWISSHEHFIDNYIQPVMSSIEGCIVNAKCEFMKGLLRLVVVKLSLGLPRIHDDDDLFSLTVQETLNFERELRLGLAYPPSFPSVLCVLTQPTVFDAWIAIERKFCLELMDEFVCAGSAWFADDEGEMSECGERMVLLLQGVTDRYRTLSEPGHRLQFLELQLELLDDFRVRLLQMTKSEMSDLFKSNYISILNTVHHLVAIISDWADLPFFIELHYFKARFSRAEKSMAALSSNNEPGLLYSSEGSNVPESVYQDILTLFTRMETYMLDELSRHVLTEIRARSQPYRRDKWFGSPSGGFPPSSVIEISPSFCSFLETLVKHLLLLRKNLAPRLFTRTWKELAQTLDKFIYEEVVLENTFSEYGATQLNYDMSRALFPIFGEFTTIPEKSFPYVKDSCTLLTLSRPAAFLLRDFLQAAGEGDLRTNGASAVKYLAEVNVGRLSVQEALVILNIRTNMAALC